MKFKSSAELFAAGYAVPSYDIDTNTTHWRYKGEAFVSPRVLCTEQAEVSGSRVAVYPIAKLEAYRARKTD
jgi:hypothetical protein